MAVEIFFRKLHHVLVPADLAQMELMEALKPNGEYKAVLTQPRHPLFHRKAFALTKVGYDAWEPPAERQYKGRPILKSFESFRDEMTIRAGFYDVVWNMKGEMRLIPHSWSWGATDQEKFERMYSAFIDVILRDVLRGYSKDDLEDQVQRVLEFC
jgi:hypothetical protein